MRLNSNFGKQADAPPLVGSLLLAHPDLHDPNFARSVILLTAHTTADGAIGVMLNRPLDRKLGELDSKVKGTSLENVPLYRGGPVSTDQVILVAWKYEVSQGAFKLYFGIDGTKARQILAEDPDFELRAFMGYSGWSERQLEGELEQDSWVVSRLLPALEQSTGDPLWRTLLHEVRPELGLWADEPEDLSNN